jgi:glycosyltransferase involved in cell wall biosynthesis
MLAVSGAGVAERKLRMLIVGAFPAKSIREHGGILTSCRALLSSSLPQRMELILVDSSSPTVPPPPYLNRLLRAVWRVTLAVKHLVRSSPDLILLFASPGPSFIEKSLVAAIARLLGTKTLMFPRGAELLTQYRASRLNATVLRLCFRAPNLMLCQGSAYQDFFTHHIGLRLDRCPIIHNWTATDQLLNIGATRTHAQDDVPLEVLFLGWIEREKGIFELLECAKRLTDTPGVPPFTLVIAGDGSAMADVTRHLDDRRMTSVVQLLGWIDSDAKVERLRRAHVLVLPSYMEGMPNSVIEAMAAGLPVVATDVGAVVDVVADGVSGFVIPPRDADRLFDALRRLLLDASLRARMGRAGWHIAKDRFDAERAVDRIVELANRVGGRDACWGISRWG